MPYIPPEDRPEYDPLIDQLAEKIKEVSKKYGYDGAWAGELNYCLSRLSLKVLPCLRYWALAILEGIFGHLAKEVYRRIGGLYEDRVIGKNGDVKEYVEHINHINQSYVK